MKEDNITYIVQDQTTQIPQCYIAYLQLRTRQEIAEAMRVDIRILRIWLQDAGLVIPSRRHLTPVEVLMIFQTIGWPPLA